MSDLLTIKEPARSSSPSATAPHRRPDDRAIATTVAASDEFPEVAAETERIRGLRRDATRSVIEIGKALIEAKGKLRHGQFIKWLKREFKWTTRTAERFMLRARRAAEAKTKNDTVSHFKSGPATSERKGKGASDLKAEIHTLHENADEMAKHLGVTDSGGLCLYVGRGDPPAGFTKIPGITDAELQSIALRFFKRAEKEKGAANERKLEQRQRKSEMVGADGSEKLLQADTSTASATDDAVSALTNLGLQKRVARDAVAQAQAAGVLTTEDLVKYALRPLALKKTA